MLGAAFAVLNTKSPKGTQADAARFFNNLKSLCYGFQNASSSKAISLAQDAAQNEKDVEKGMNLLLTKYALRTTR